MLEITNLSKQFYQNKSQHQVVDKLTLKVKKGEVYGFLGPNGAGKTTTVKMIAGLLYPDQGSITVNGHAAGSLEAQATIGFMPESPQFYRHLKAKEVLEFAGELFGIDKDELSKRSTKLLQEVGLAAAANVPAKDFSKGMHQRLAFAVAMINDPQLLILDEPLDGLDPIGRLDFKQLIRRWQKGGRTIFFSSHILSDVEELCSTVGILADGRLVKEGSPQSLVKKGQSLEDLFVSLVRS